MFDDLDWPLNASRRFVSISWTSCSHWFLLTGLWHPVSENKMIMFGLIAVYRAQRSYRVSWIAVFIGKPAAEAAAASCTWHTDTRKNSYEFYYHRVPNESQYLPPPSESQNSAELCFDKCIVNVSGMWHVSSTDNYYIHINSADSQMVLQSWSVYGESASDRWRSTTRGAVKKHSSALFCDSDGGGK